MGSNELKPFMRRQRSEKRVSHTILAQIASFGFFDERQSPPTNFPEFRQHFFFLANAFAIDRKGRFAPKQPRFNEGQRDVKPLEKRTPFRRFLQ